MYKVPDRLTVVTSVHFFAGKRDTRRSSMPILVSQKVWIWSLMWSIKVQLAKEGQLFFKL